MRKTISAGTALVLCLLFVLFSPPDRAFADETYNTYSTGVKIIEYGATGTPSSYCSNLRVEDGGVKDVFCIEPGVDFAGGPKTRVDALTVIPQEKLTEAALGVYYLSTIAPPEGLSRLGWQQYWIWVHLRSVTVPNVTDIWVRNGPSEEVQDRTLSAIRAYVAANKANFTGFGWIYTDGSSQRAARFWVEGKGSVRLTKKASEVPDFAAEFPELYSLKGAEYSVFSSPTLAGGSRVGTIITDGSGRTGSLSLPAGTYYVVETKAPYGYLRNPSVMEKTLTAGESWEIEAEDQPLFSRAKILLEKIEAAGAPCEVAGAEKTGRPADGFKAAEAVPELSLAGAEFEVKYYPTLSDERENSEPARIWTFRTDADGLVRLSDEYLCGGDELFRDGSGEPVLPLGTYTFRETAAPEGFLLNDEVFVRQVTADHGAVPETAVYSYPVVEEYRKPLIGTEAFWTGGTGNMPADGETVLVDRVTCERLVPGAEYMLKASLIDPADGSVIALGEKCFSASEGDAGGVYCETDGAYIYAEADVSIEADKTALAGLAGRRLVVFEELYMAGTVDGWTLVAEEKTADSPDQSIFVPDISTTASVSSVGSGGAPTLLTDVIEYSGLEPGVEIRIETVLMDRASGEPARDEKGGELRSETLITPESENGSLEIILEVPTELIRGRELVFFESAYEGDALVVSHSDIDNARQTVMVPTEPEKPQEPEVPLTGDTGSARKWLELFGGSAFLLMCAALAGRKGLRG